MKNQGARPKNMFSRLGVICLAVTLFLPYLAQAKVSNDPEPSQWGYTDTNVYQAWDTTVGSHSVVVAVIDNGFDTFHPDLADNVWKNPGEIPENAVDDDGNGYVDDVWGWNFVPEDQNGDGQIDEAEQKGSNDPRPSVFSIDMKSNDRLVVHHGTLVAGIIGAVGNNADAGSGLNWNVRLMNVKVIGNGGSGDFARLGEAIRYAVDNGAHIINMSMVGTVERSVKDAVKYAYDHGVVVIAAAGNDLVVLDYVERYPICVDTGEAEQWVLGVSAIYEAHRIANFSNVGSCVDITAPGVNIASTMRYAPAYGFTEEYGGGWNGTSFSAPFVTGAAALIKSIHPSWQAKDIYKAILSTAHKTPPKDEQEYAMLFGAGLLQIDKAVEYAKAQTVPGETESLVTPLGQVSGVKILRDEAVSAFLARAANGAAEGVTANGAAPPFMLGRVQTVAAGMWQGENIYVVIRPRVSGAAVVEIRSVSGEKLFVWSVPTNGYFEVHVRDVMGDSAPEIILAPRAASQTVYTVYSLEGVELAKASVKEAHAGVSLAFDKRQAIFALYKDASGMAVHEFHNNLDTGHSFAVPRLAAKGLLARGDVDGDGVVDFVITGGGGEQPYVLVYSGGGVLVAEKLAYEESYRSGVLLAVVDANGDGAVDIVTVPVLGGLPMRVWNGTLDAISEKKLAKEARGYVLTPVYE